MAQDAVPARATFDLVRTRSTLSAGLPDGEANYLRGTWALAGGDVLRAELLDERKFGDHGGIAGLSYTAVLSPDWYGTGTVVGGVGGPNWANNRVDLQLSRKWLPNRQLVTSAAYYHAAFDNRRSDAGARLSAVLYLDAPVVLEAGVILNVSQPGSIHSHMPYASATLGREGVQYFSLRASRGTEAYQALGSQAQLVNFSSRSLGAIWKLWLGPRWGLNAQAEYYENPTYHRSTLGAGLFVQW
jgi:YaiO family outer membrane protein